MSKKHSRLASPLSHIINGARLVYARLRRPWSGHTQDDVLDGESDSPVRAPIGTSMDLGAKAKLQVLASFQKTSLGKVLDQLVTEAFDKGAPNWPPKTLSRRLRKYSKKEWAALERKRQRSEEREEARHDKRMAHLIELKRGLESPSQAVREAACVQVLRLIAESRGRR